MVASHAAGARIDLLDAVLGDLIKVPAVECRSGVRGNADRAHHPAARRIERVQPVSGRKPDMPTIEGDAMDMVGVRKGSIFSNNFGC